MSANDSKSKYLDIRTSERYIKKGLLSNKDYESYVKALPDDEANAAYVQMDVHDTEFSSSDDEDGADDPSSEG